MHSTSEAQRTLDGVCFRCRGNQFIVIRDARGQPVRRDACPRCKGTGKYPPEAHS